MVGITVTKFAFQIFLSFVILLSRGKEGPLGNVPMDSERPTFYYCISFIGCYYTVQQSGCLKTRDIYFHTVLEAPGPKSKC